MSKEDIEKAVHPEGLYSPSPWISWGHGDEEVQLDGDFSAEDLRAIADHMDANARKVER